MTDFFSSDGHFWHRKILEYCSDSRPFDSIEEMNEGLIERWNDRVRPEDHIYYLGDFSFGTHDQTEEILKRLKGNIHLILGNHDRIFEGNLKNYLTSVSHYKEIPTKRYGKSIVLFHFPIESWHRMSYGARHFHGHLHSNSASNHHPCNIMPNRMDVGVDAHPDCAPWSWEEIKEKLNESS